MIRLTASHSEDRGAVLIYVAVVMVGLLAMATYVVDFGMFWVARQQAQNAADAAAYGAAVALSQDPALDRTDDGAARQTALLIGRRNLVWGETPSIVSADVTFPACPFDGTDTCVRVAVYRNVARGNPLPAVFGRLIGLTTQDVQAVATAEVRPGNVNKCLKPWAVPDRWTDVTGSPTRFDKYDSAGHPLATQDVYQAPSATSTGTGYRLDRDLGTQVTLSQNAACASFAALALNSACVATTGSFLPISMTSVCSGSTYLSTIVGCTACTGVPVDVVGLNDQPQFSETDVSGAAGPTQSGAQALIALDPNAVFNPLTRKVENSCVGGGGIPYTCSQSGLVESPRIVALPAYDVDWFEDRRRLGASGDPVPDLIRVSNILSVFVDSAVGGTLTTHIVSKSASFDPTKSKVTGGSAFTRTLLIVR